MNKNNDLKSQRDRFLAFSFAGADLLLEIDSAGEISYAAGALKSMTGREEHMVMNQSYLDLFKDEDQALLKTMHAGARPGSKQGPYLVTLKQNRPQLKPVRAFVTGMKMPGEDAFYLTLSQGGSLLRLMGFESEEGQKVAIANKDNFSDLARKKINDVKASGEDVKLTMLELGDTAKYESKMNKDQWENFLDSINDTILSSSVDGEAAAKLDHGRYVVLHDASTASTEIEKRIEMLFKAADPKGDGVKVQTKSMDANLPNLNERETTRAMIYTMNQFEQAGMDLSTPDLRVAFKDYLDTNTIKIQKLKHLVAHQRFHLNFQPVVSLETRTGSHYEVLTRFEDNKSPYELIVFGEDIGIAPDIDLAVCRQTLKFIDQHNVDADLAVNLSGVSVQSEIFIDTLLSTLNEYPNPAKSIMFEITESTMIKDLDHVNALIQRIRQAGHKICLDDFGAGAASFQYLHKLEIDGVKIDGAYVKRVLESPRDATLIKNMTQMCRELDIFVVAEMIETEEQARYLRDIGVDKGQGYLFGKPAATLL